MAHAVGDLVAVVDVIVIVTAIAVVTTAFVIIVIVTVDAISFMAEDMDGVLLYAISVGRGNHMSPFTADLMVDISRHSHTHYKFFSTCSP